MSATDTIQTDLSAILRGIANGAADGCEKAVYDAINARRRSLASITAGTLRVGDRVVVGNIRPARLNGREGVITSLPRSGNSKRFGVKLDGDDFPMSGMPAACLTKVGD